VRRRAGWKQSVDGAVLSLVLSAAVVFPALKRRVARLCSPLRWPDRLRWWVICLRHRCDPGREDACSAREHTSFSAAAFGSTEAVVSMMSDCTSCHENSNQSMATKAFLLYRTERKAGNNAASVTRGRLAPPRKATPGSPTPSARPAIGFANATSIPGTRPVAGQNLLILPQDVP
jgi:hypothetical protein